MIEKSTTEQDSNYNGLENMSVAELLKNINQEDKTVPLAISDKLHCIESLVEAVVPRMKKGGRLFYIGAGTSGRLGIVDASECPPTFGVDHDLVIGIIAGGDSAIRKAVEFAEDDRDGGWNDLSQYQITKLDSVIGIAASGRTPYVIGALEKCQEIGILTGCIVCNEESEVAKFSDHPIEIVVGPEFITGSTRMKAGTAQKLTLNMISSAIMIQLGKVRGNKMVDMQLSNKKLIIRGTEMIREALDIDEAEAHKLLIKHGSVRSAINKYKN